MHLEDIILREVTQSQKMSLDMHSLISGYYPRNLEYPRYNLQNKKIKKEDQLVDSSFLLRMGNKISMEGVSYRDKVWSWDKRMDHPETTPPGDSSHNQPPNTETIAYASKILLTRPWYSCLLWGYASARQIQKWMLTVIYWIEHRTPNLGAREKYLRSWRSLQPYRWNNNMN